jgi:carboxyl-terminal processing protease
MLRTRHLFRWSHKRFTPRPSATPRYNRFRNNLHRFLALLLCASALPAADDLDKRLQTFIDAFALVEQNAADPIASEQVFYQGAIPGLLRKLDPHSVFFDPGQFEQLKKMESSTQKGFGTVVSILPGRVIVLQTLPGTPSAKAGLAAGDEIVGINGYVINRLDLDQLTELLTESRQRPAQLDVMRPGNNRVTQMVLTPEDMQTPSVDRTFFISPGIGYVRAASFDEHTGKDLQKAIDKLGGDHLAGLVLDLRNNPGGVVTAALETASLFLKPGQKIFTIRGRNVPEKSELVPENAEAYGFKLVVLVNEKSASASEIVTGALQDHDRATVVGEVTYGKGLVQSVYPLSQGTGLALTTALYYTPSGRSIQKPLDVNFELGATTAHPNRESEFHTDKGRAVKGGGGIQPDVVAGPAPMNRLQIALDASGSFVGFATDYLARHKVDEDFEVAPSLIDEFEAWVGARGILPGSAEWSTQLEFVRNRLKTEILTQAFGVDRGDQVEAQRDPAILKALEILVRR